MTEEEITEFICREEEAAKNLRLRWERVAADDGRSFNDIQLAGRIEGHLKVIRHLLNERKWQPIETAPHDKWLILAEAPSPPGTKWTVRTGKASWGDKLLGTRNSSVFATHWMPVPKSPIEKEQSSADEVAQTDEPA